MASEKTVITSYSIHYTKLYEGVWEHRTAIDDLIRQAAENWRLERMTLVDRNILRLGAYEIGRSGDIPFVVAINSYHFV